MSHKLSVLFSQKLVKLGTIPKEHEAVYIYGFELICSFLFSVTLILILGAMIRKIIETVVFLILFILIRQFTGGFHATTYLKCQVCTICFYFFAIGLTLNIRPSIGVVALLMIFGTLVILIIGPIESPNKPLSNHQRKKNKRRGVVLFECACMLGFFFYRAKPFISGMIFYSLLLIIILMIIPYLERRIHHA